MSEELEALGAAATAGLAAAVIEPPQAPVVNSEASHDTAHDACANCDTVLMGEYCWHCGQAAHTHRSLLHMGEELLHGVFHFDTKAWHTVPMLIFRPGQLTYDYVHGHRVRYVSPLALFLFLVFLSFFVASFTNNKSGDHVMSPAVKQAQIADYTKQLNEAKAAVAKATADVVAATSKGENPGEARERLENAQQEMDEITSDLQDLTPKAESAQPPTPPASATDSSENNVQSDTTRIVKVGPIQVDVGQNDKAATATVGAPGADEHVVHSHDAMVEEIASKMRKETFMSGSTWFDLALKHSLDNPDLALYKLKNTAYKLSFMLVPISLPFMWLLFFWKRGVKMFDHVVFVLYSLCFMFLLFVGSACIYLLGVKPEVAGVVVLIPPVHIFAQLRGAYRLGIFSALWRTGAMVVSNFIVLTLFFLFVLVISMH